MFKTRNLTSFRLVILGSISIFALSISACAPKAEMEVVEEPMEEVVEVMEEVVEVMEEVAPLVVSDDTHVVSAGESLWSISGLTSIYNDSFRWPLIYGHNKDIEDADLIHPGQELSIPRALFRADIDAAVAHAKNRGSWAIGVIEESDLQYRANSM